MKKSSRLRSERYGDIQSSVLLDYKSSEKGKWRWKEKHKVTGIKELGREEEFVCMCTHVAGHIRIEYKYAHVCLCV